MREREETISIQRAQAGPDALLASKETVGRMWVRGYNTVEYGKARLDITASKQQTNDVSESRKQAVGIQKFMESSEDVAETDWNFGLGKTERQSPA